MAQGRQGGTGPRTRMNRQIRVPEVRCVGADGEQIGVMDTRDAIALAESKGLDLVEIAPMARPPVCRLMDYGKFKYDRDKKQRQQRRNQTQTKVKEVKFHANVADNDYATKLRHATEFLEEGHRVKFSLYFRGRENAHRELGFELMNRAAADMKEYITIEQAPQLMGRQLVMLVSPSPKLRARKN
ncbi:MAG: translation initiation factor IF-3 [Candidatus Marinimicrobia bacterium]|nr:translation initiation factor IF-3 [Candidatus Neomarinimicrobiota bacterium]